MWEVDRGGTESLNLGKDRELTDVEEGRGGKGATDGIDKGVRCVVKFQKIFALLLKVEVEGVQGGFVQNEVRQVTKEDRFEEDVIDVYEGGVDSDAGTCGEGEQGSICEH